MLGTALPAAAGPLTAGRALVVVVAGAAAGLFNGVAGGGTLVSFPVLLGLGYPALTANVTNTVGIWPGYLGSVAGFRTEIVAQRDRVRSLVPPAAVGAVVGAVLLVTTPSSAFTRLVPWLVLFASVLFAVQPVLVRALSSVAHDHPTRRALLLAGTFLTAVYGGYFGGAMGIMLLAVLGLALPDTLARSSGLRSILSVLVNGIAAVVFLVHSPLVWSLVGLLALGSLAGGWAGARLALRLPTAALRAVVVAIGLATTVKLLVG
jgi:uncharacterized membrane protein YfcA